MYKCGPSFGMHTDIATWDTHPLDLRSPQADFFWGFGGALLRKYIPESIVEDTFCAKYSKKFPKIPKKSKKIPKKCMGIKFVGIKNFEIPRNQNAKDTNHKSSCDRP